MNVENQTNWHGFMFVALWTVSPPPPPPPHTHTRMHRGRVRVPIFLRKFVFLGVNNLMGKIPEKARGRVFNC